MESVTAATLFPTPLNLDEAAALSPQIVLQAVQGWSAAEAHNTRLQQQLQTLKEQVDALKHQLDWHHKNERQKMPAVISGDFDGALVQSPNSPVDSRRRYPYFLISSVRSFGNSPTGS